MYIQPDTQIRILKNVPLDPTYDHTIWFLDEAHQVEFFSSKTKYTLNDQTYQRVQRGYMRVEVRAENLYDCNYLMFQNSAFGNKWFYAFITAVEYVNNEVSQIAFALDVMQTWYFNYTLDKCFVDREHSATDILFDNLVEENLDLGDGYIANSTSTYNMNNMNIAILVSKVRDDDTEEWVPPSGSVVNGVYYPIGCLTGFKYPYSDANNVIQGYVEAGQEDAIIGIYMYPARFEADKYSQEAYTDTFQAVANLGDTAPHFGGYVPKNKKLYQYPYNYLLVSNNAGSTATYKWEDFTYIQRDNYATFMIRASIYGTPSCMIYPTFHRGIEQDYDSGIVYDTFPQCAWIGDVWKAWWAQHRSSVTTALVASTIASLLGGTNQGFSAGNNYGSNLAANMPASAPVVTQGTPGLVPMSNLMTSMVPYQSMNVGSQFAGIGAAAGVMGAVAGGLLNGLKTAGVEIAGLVAKKHDLERTPPQVHGQTNLDMLNVGMKRIMFSFYNMSIKLDAAKRIDDYFDRFGYAVHEHKVPNRNVRQTWTYTRTVGCTITGSIPADDAKAICDIYDHGITFWNNGNNVGNYNLSNKPTGGVG